MMNWAKLLRNRYLFVIVTTVFLSNCSKEEKVTTNVVQVNDAVLTENDLNRALGEEKNHGKYREEYIQNWIETEVLYKKAVDEGITQEKDFKSLVELNMKQLAAAMLLNKLIPQTNIDPSYSDLKKYFEEEKEDFRLTDDVFRINTASFKNFDDAVRFRTFLIGSDWQRAVNEFRGNQNLISATNDKVYDSYQIQPGSLYKMISNLSKGEISLVLETEPSKFIVVQLTEKINKGDIPPFEIVQDRVKERYIIVKRKEFIHDYIDKLIEDYEKNKVKK